MPWTCPCTAAQPDDARFCDRCGQPKQPSPVPATNQSGPLLKIVAVVAVLVVGCVFGTVIAVTAFGSRGGQASAQTNSSPDSKSRFEEAFDARFKSSYQSTAMNNGKLSRASAENYCSCALPIFKQTHYMGKTAASCQKYIVR